MEDKNILQNQEQQKEDKQHVQPKQNLKDHCEGAWLGQLIGDAIGAVLEFKPDIQEKDINYALSMQGGGLHKVGPGQITDDGELSLSLAYGLIRGKGKLNLNYIAQEYGKWYNSKPFDVGNTIRRAVPKAVNLDQHQAEMVRRGANNKDSLISQSNGSLMSILPFCIWCRNLEDQDIYKAVYEITILTHPNPLCILSNYEYQQMIKWLQEFKSGEIPPANRKSGFVKIALGNTIHYLLQQNSYTESIKDLLKKGGDTDTNCAIMGGILGAKIGKQQIPKEYIETILSNQNNKKILRPKYLRPGQVFDKYFQNLYDISLSTNQLEIIAGSQEYVKKQKQK